MGEIVTPQPTNTGANLGGIINSVIQAGQWIGSTAKTIRDNAKKRKAIEIANAGGYDTLTDYQKNLIDHVNPVRNGKIDATVFAPLSIPGIPNNVLLIFAVFGIGLYLWLVNRKNN